MRITNRCTELYKPRQKHYRIVGLFFVLIAGVVLISSFAWQEIFNESMSEWTRWGAFDTRNSVYAVLLVLWGVAFYFSLKGFLYLLFGGRGIKTKRPT